MVIGVRNLSVAVQMFERSYNRVSDIIPEFTKLCEERLKKAAGSASS